MKLPYSVLVTTLVWPAACLAPPISVGNETDGEVASGGVMASVGNSASSTGGSSGPSSGTATDGTSGTGTSSSSSSSTQGRTDTSASSSDTSASSSVTTSSSSDTTSSSSATTSSSSDTTSSSSATTSSSSDTTSSSDTGEPSPCDDGFEARSCVLAGGGMPEGFGCQWVELERLDAGGDFCGFDDSVGGRCIPTRYQGEGCIQAECGEGPGVYYRELSDGVYETFVDPGLCEHQPVDYALCLPGDDSQACQCACAGSEASLPPDFEDSFVVQGGCADMGMYAVDDAGTLALYVFVDHGLVAEAIETDAPVETVIGSSEFTIGEVVLGQDLVSRYCNDVPVGTIERRWTATGGVLEVVVEPGDGDNPTATATLRDATFQAEGGQDVISIEVYTFENIAVGWLPG